MRLLFAEDESDLNRILTKRLTEEGYSVDSCADGQEALDCIDVVEYDGAILDVMMPHVDGFAVLEAMRKKGHKTPVLFLTARDAVSDRVHGLDIGADDYLIKPFAIDELLARIRVMLRSQSGQTGNVIEVGDLTMDIASHRVARGGREIELSAKEYALLEYLMHNQGMALTREQIEDHIWNFDYEGGTNVVDVYVSYLRKKIDEGEEQKLIRTVRGVGYMIAADEK